MTEKTTLDEFQEKCDEFSNETNDGTSSQTSEESSPCPCYLEERNSEEWQEIQEEYNLYDPGCGHAISYLRRVTGAKVTQGTAKLYSSKLRIFVEYLHDNNTNFCEADAELIDRFMIMLVQRDRSESALNGYRAAISNVVKHISLFSDVECNVKREKIYEVIDLSSYNTVTELERTPLSKKEAEKLFAELDSFRDGLLVQMGIELGPRSYDLRTIKLGDVDLENREVALKNTKGNDTYTLPIGSDLALRLRHWVESERKGNPHAEDSPYLFPNQYGGHLSSIRLNEIIKDAATAAGIQKVIGTMSMTPRQKETLGTEKAERRFYRVTAHTLRHTFSDLLDDAGMDLAERSAALNHKSTDITEECYTHRKEEYKETIEELFSNISMS